MANNGGSLLERIYSDSTARPWYIYYTLYRDRRLCDLTPAERAAIPIKGIGQEKMFSQKRKSLFEEDPSRLTASARHKFDRIRYAFFGNHASLIREPAATKEELFTQSKFTNKLLKNIVMEEQSKEQINLTIEAEDGQVEIIHRYGEASEIQEPKAVNITGTIDAPSEYFGQRVDEGEIDTKKAHLEVWQDKGVISLKLDPSSPIGGEINGSITMNPLLKRMRINDYGGSKRGEDEFILLLKETRSLFVSQRESMDLVDKINNLEIEVNKKIDRTDDERGGRKDFYEQTCEDKLPGGFDLTTNIFVGAPDETVEHTFHVEIKYHYKSQLYFWLESPQMQEIVDEVMESTLGEEIEKFEGQIPIIYK